MGEDGQREIVSDPIQRMLFARESKMSITADNSWDTRGGFSVPNESCKTHIVSDCGANILGVEDHQARRFPGNPGSSVEEGDFVGKLEAVDADHADEAKNTDDENAADDDASW